MLALLLTLLQPAFACWAPPPREEILSSATSIVDATLTHFDRDGHAHLYTHTLIGGKPTDEIFTVYRECIGPIAAQGSGLKEGSRYLFVLLSENDLMGNLVFSVEENMVIFWTSRKELGRRDWQPVDQVFQTIRDIRARAGRIAKRRAFDRGVRRSLAEQQVETP